MRRRPYAVVLLDEVEKAHPEVFDILLQVLDDGRLTDGQGRTVDFRNVIMILTSNLGSQYLADPKLDAKLKRDAVMGVVRQAFKPEFLNRLDEIVLFDALDTAELAKIVEINLGRLNARLADRRITVVATQAARDWLALTGFDPIVRRPPAAAADPDHDRGPAGPAGAGRRGARGRHRHLRPRPRGRRARASSPRCRRPSDRTPRVRPLSLSRGSRGWLLRTMPTPRGLDRLRGRFRPGTPSGRRGGRTGCVRAGPRSAGAVVARLELDHALGVVRARRPRRRAPADPSRPGRARVTTSAGRVRGCQVRNT